MSCNLHMSHVTVGGAITDRTSTKTTVYSGDKMLNAFIAALPDFNSGG